MEKSSRQTRSCCSLISKDFNDTSNNQAYNDVACAVEKM